MGSLTYTKSDHDALKAHYIPARAAGLGINHYTGYPGSPVRAIYNPLYPDQY
jgi:TPP-dependent indolepyruvate ferredoxin oxidoreductase alpha subunit